MGEEDDEEEEEEDAMEVNSITPLEKTLIKECLDEAMWYRAVPMAVVFGGIVYRMVRTGRLKSNRYFGAFPKVLLTSTVAYWTGKISYIIGTRCSDKFLQKAPDGKIAEIVRKEREMDDHSSQHSDDFAVGGRVFHRGPEIHISRKERAILMECNDRAFYTFSVPLSILLGFGMYQAQVKGWLRESSLSWFNRYPRMAKVPKTVLGVGLGYFFGQVLYLRSGDCEERIIKEVPQGNLAGLLLREEQQKKPKESERLTGTAHLTVNNVDQQQDYLLPSSEDMGDHTWMEDAVIRLPKEFRGAKGLESSRQLVVE